jgi:hypothetical protein
MSVSARMFQSRRRARVHASRPCVARELRPIEKSRRCDRRLPSSQRSVSILQSWCTLTFMHVDARLALNQSWDHGG